MVDIIDISNIVSLDEMPVCPLCDNEIEEGDQVSLVKSNGCVGLAHEFCAEEFVGE